MRVLDIDLDLFLEDTCPLAPVGERPCLEGHRPWPEADVRRFLEDCCGLDRARPIPGRVFDTHDKALFFWQERIADGSLTVPFDVTHADAHSDLGIGYPGTAPVLSGVLPVRFPERTDVARYLARKQLDEANYLLFALGFRYVRALDNVRNPRSKKDIPEELWVRDDPTGSLTDNPSGADAVPLLALRCSDTLGSETALRFHSLPSPASLRSSPLHKGGFKENALNKGGLEESVFTQGSLEGGADPSVSFADTSLYEREAFGGAPMHQRESALRLSSFAAQLTEGVNGPEPLIPYREYADPFSFRAEGPYDFMTVAVSPRYAPAEADMLLPLFTSYMTLI